MGRLARVQATLYALGVSDYPVPLFRTPPDGYRTSGLRVIGRWLASLACVLPDLKFSDRTVDNLRIESYT